MMAQIPGTHFSLHNGDRCVVRCARAEDAAAIIRYLQQIADESPHLATEAFEFDFTEAEEQDYIARLGAGDTSLFLVAELRGAIIGVVTLEGHAKNRMKHVADLGISVVRSHWGQGLGRALMETAISWAESCPALKKITLTVHARNRRAIDLYLKLGFAKEGVIIDLLHIDGRFHDCWNMGRAV